MKAALTVWNGRIAPLFDSARCIVTLNEDIIPAVLQERSLPEGNPTEKIRVLVSLGIDTLVCGAITRCARDMAMSMGIEVIGFLAGDAEEITRNIRDGTFDPKVHVMPGCKNNGRCRRWGVCREKSGEGPQCSAGKCRHGTGMISGKE